MFERFFVHTFLTQKYLACQQCHQLILSLYLVLRSFQFFNLLQMYLLTNRIVSLSCVIKFCFLYISYLGKSTLNINWENEKYNK